MFFQNVATCDGVSKSEIHQTIAFNKYDIVTIYYQMSFSCFQFISVGTSPSKILQSTILKKT